jgi:uncharacterized membrane protein
MDNFPYSLILALHIAGGTSALLSGPFTLLTRWQSRSHKIASWVHFIAMTATCVSGFAMSLILEIPFLAVIAIFSYYSTFTGFRSFTAKVMKPTIGDGIAIILGIPAAFYMFSTGETILAVFGSFFALGLIVDTSWILLRKPMNEVEHRVHFVNRFGGSYIATITAFLVVNYSHIEPMWIWWLAPSAIGSPLLGYLVFRTRKNLMAAKA